MQNKIIIGNWKMNPASTKEAESLFTGVAKNILKIKNTKIVICPPFLYTEKLKKISKKIILGAQDLFPGEVGAFTGAVSSFMLSNIGVKFVILGHSERRAMGETNIDINKKIKSAIANGLCPILCVGETVRDPNHEYFNLVKTQLEECLSGIKKSLISDIIIAYEPVWALSSTVDRRDATALDSEEMVIFIRKVLTDKFGAESASARILYGGSVNEKDALDFLEHGGVDGLLVGKASLDVKKFTEIIKITENLYGRRSS
jgi:triosephosphate isomerase